MRTLLRGLLALIIVLPLALLVAAVLALQSRPLVAQPAVVLPSDVARVTAQLRYQSQRRSQPGAMRAAMLTERDLELLLAQAGRRVATDARPRVTLQARQAAAQLSLKAPDNPIGEWINLRLVLRQADGLPTIESLHVGALRVPAWLGRWAVARWLQAHNLAAQGDLALRMVNRVTFLPRLAVVAFAWPDGGVRQALADTLLPGDEQRRLRAYVERVAELSVRTGQPRWRMVDLMPPVFALARERSAGQGPAAGSPADEARAAVLALALATSPGSVTRLVPAAAQWAAPRVNKVTLRGREDFPQHFLVSAVITAEGGGPLADAVGVYKELADTHGGSGFSFNDIAADRAGTRFALRLMAEPEAMMQRLSAGVSEDELLPPIEDLPEFMTARQFVERYGGLNSPAYRAMLADIEARLDRLPLLAPVPR